MRTNPAGGEMADSDLTGDNVSEESGEESSHGSTTDNDELFEPLQPYDAPPLAEIDASANWIDQKVAYGRDLLRERLQDHPPLVSEEEALSLKNESEADNEKIYSVMRQLPESADQVDWEATYVHHFAGEANSLNPLMRSSVVDGELQEMTGLMLIAFDADFTPFAVAWAVESWQTSEDHMMDKFVLRDDLTWSDGKPVTAHDVVFAFKTIMNPRVTIPAIRSSVQHLKWVEAYDDQTIVMFHKKPMASWTENIQFPVIPKHIYEKSVEDDPTMETSKYHLQFLDKPVTCGPYKFVSRERGQETVLERRDEWWQKDGKEIRPRPYFKRIRCRVITDPNTTLLSLKKGDLDTSTITAEQWLTQTSGKDFYDRNTKMRGLEWSVTQVIWNTSRPYFRDKRTRQALALAFDHQEMLETIYYGLTEPGRGTFHPTAWMASKNPTPYERDLDAAEDLLAEAGWGDEDGDGFLDKRVDGRLVPFQFTILCPEPPNAIKICNLLKDNLAQIGIKCDVKVTEWTALQDKSLKHQFDAMLSGWGTGTDPATLDNIFKTGGGRNYGRYSNERVDELFELAQLEFDRDERAGHYAEIHEILWEDQPYMWLYYRPSLYGVNKKIRGFNFSPRDPFGVNPGILGLWMPKD
ncbi:peptide-binding protein [Aeoliella sp.]|uniref:peptide-binding protein n=1 Tax=Aeoliella sp. TaxID=2795800 RepID=UPI003CCC1CB7